MESDRWSLMRNRLVSFVGTLPPIKGNSHHCQQLVEALSKYVRVEFIGFKKLYPEFLYPGGTRVKDEYYKTPEIRNTNIRSILTYYNPFSWAWAGLTAKGDVIHAQWWSYVLAPVYFTMLLICKLRRKKIIITVHNPVPHEKRKLNDFLNRVPLPLADRFIVHTEQSKKQLSGTHGIPEERISVIPVGSYMPPEMIPSKEARCYFGVPENNKTILYFGNIRDYKGVGVLLESLKFVIDTVENVTLILAGQPWIDWKKFEEIITRNRLEYHVIKKLYFIPPSEVGYYFSAAELVVLPYKYFDSQSGAAALALACKKPLVVTSVGGLPDFVKDRKAVAKPDDPQDLARVIIQVLKDQKLLGKLGKDSEELAKEYSWDKIAKETVRLYASSLGEPWCGNKK